MTRTWFITGTSRGFGRDWTRAVLQRGERVAAAARDPRTLDELVSEFGDAILPLALDVTGRAACFEAVRTAHEHFGRLDVIVNNAGYMLQGMVEELPEDEMRRVIDTNLLGALWVTQAALPFLRAQGSGHIIQVSSVGGVLAFSGTSAYNATKWGLEGLSEALSLEVASFGIRVTLIEPGGFATDAVASARSTKQLPAYGPIYDAAAKRQAARRVTLGDPVASAEILMEIVDAEDPPLRVFLGGRWLAAITAEYEGRLAGWREWQDAAERSEGVGQPGGAVLAREQ